MTSQRRKIHITILILRRQVRQGVSVAVPVPLWRIGSGQGASLPAGEGGCSSGRGVGGARAGSRARSRLSRSRLSRSRLSRSRTRLSRARSGSRPLARSTCGGCGALQGAGGNSRLIPGVRDAVTVSCPTHHIISKLKYFTMS